jgi:hypothetical protein
MLRPSILAVICALSVLVSDLDARGHGNETRISASASAHESGSLLPEYWDTESIRKTQKSWYFIENSTLRFLEAHVVARAAERLPHPRELMPLRNFADYGHWIEAGSGLVAAKREILREHESFGVSSFRVEQLTIYLPMGLAETPGRIKFGGKGPTDPMIFWSVWGHDLFVCYAYATEGTISYRRLPAPAHIGSRLAPYRRDDPYVQTLAVDLDIRFGLVFDERSTFGDKDEEEAELCPPFSVRESLEFYWRPAEVVIRDYQG